MATSSKVKPTTKIAPFTARKAAQPVAAPQATIGTVDDLKAAVKDLDGKAKELLPRLVLGPPLTATRAQARQMRELQQIEEEIERLTVGLTAKASAIRSDLSAAVDSAGASELVATSEGLRYCAEPRGAGVQLRSRTVGHALRSVKK
jgi:hypothetical protein